ncbi:DNA replication/repair protein RecF [Lyngbya confervoides]|uniref:DNA replication and repair protein RecF n=1 Tax=Lyngbya confervoides BDU141951 TaxID=1574623 RepID=A0ABD4T4Q3_9CYAN|nr:DNA replication/repair protein RecF [Lyngbya confervoides]MCM1983398.1 DNA replication/repair protein RecF [Lyngbya confervoides BDU141951]
MYLNRLALVNFRNYAQQTLGFSAPKTILVGENAQGKSNLLEAIELLSTLRSHRTSRDRDLVRENETQGQILAEILRDSGQLDLSLTLRSRGRRTLTLNSEPQRRHLDVLGALNTVEFSSLDLDLVRGGPTERRNWLDAVLLQLEPIYAYLSQQYHHILKQRNALLKQHRREENRPLDPQQLQLWNQQLATIGAKVMQRRIRLMDRLQPLAQSWHSAISGQIEQLHLNYLPSVPWETEGPDQIYATFLDRLSQRAIAEQSQGMTLVGPHRDDVQLTINETPARQYGSQGQQRTLVLALKLAELQLIESVIGEPPVLLLDDVLAELDLKRQNQLLEAIQDRFQTIITTTHLGAFDAHWLESAEILTVSQGQILT